MIFNDTFHRDFWHLKVTQPLPCFPFNLVHMFLNQCSTFVSSSCWIFILSPIGFLASPMENLLLGLIPDFYIFHGESTSPHRGTKTGCLDAVISVLFLLQLLLVYVKHISESLIFQYLSYYQLEEKNVVMERLL